MKASPQLKKAVPAIIMVALLLITAFLAAGALVDRLLPEPDGPPAEVHIVEVNTEGLGGTYEHDHLPVVALGRTEYDLGVRLQGFEEQSGVLLMLSISLPDIAVGEVEGYYYNPATYTWWQISFVDQGDVLVAQLSPGDGYGIDEDFDLTTYLLLTFEMGGAYEVEAWYELP